MKKNEEKKFLLPSKYSYLFRLDKDNIYQLTIADKKGTPLLPWWDELSITKNTLKSKNIDIKIFNACFDFVPCGVKHFQEELIKKIGEENYTILLKETLNEYFNIVFFIRDNIKN